MPIVSRAGFAVAAGVVVFVAGARSATLPAERTVASVCPPGFVSGERLATEAARERRAQNNGLRPAMRETDRPLGPYACRSRSAPERIGELLTIQNESGRRARGGQAGVRRGAYAAAARQAARLDASGGTWEPAGKGPLVADDPRFESVNGLGHAELNGRIADFAYDAGGNRLYAAVGEGGVWRSDDKGQTWRSIGDALPTQAVGSIEYAGGTLVIVTGDNVFGGGGTFAGLGAFRSTDGGATWQPSSGIPQGVIAFKVAADPTRPGVFYAATGAGLYRSSDNGASFQNVRLPVSPECTGASADSRPCALANMVTDVVVQGAANAQTPGGTPGAVLAAVGWRAGAKQSPYGYAEAPGNGVYRSDTGAPGSFSEAGGFPNRTGLAEIQPGRIELGAATGAAQDHRYVYALVQDATKFTGEFLDTPLDLATPSPTNLAGVYVSADFGQTWRLMESAEEMVADQNSGSALNGTACAIGYCPGIQSWYNQWIAPDPSRATAAGVPTRLAFGLEEIWAASGSAQDGLVPSQFKVVGPYFSGDTCIFLSVPAQTCPTIHSDPGYNTTTHPDQHAATWLPDGAGVTLVAGHDGGVNTQTLVAGGELDPDAWGRGSNAGFHTLLPYDAQVAKDGTIWAGLQDNGEMKIEPDGRQFMTFGGDGTFSAVDPDDSDIAYESTPNNAMAKTTDGGQTWEDVPPPEDTYQFVNPFVMDPVDANHLLTAGNRVHETTDGAANWETVYDLGTRTKPGDPAAAGAAGDPDNVVSAIDVRGTGVPLPPGGQPTPGFTWQGGTGTVPGAVGQTGGVDVPGTYADREFTIAPGEANGSATITVTWADGTNDWDLVVFRREGDTLKVAGSSGQGVPTTSEQVVLSRPPAGQYVIRVRNYAAAGSFDGRAAFAPAAAGDTVAGASAAYVAYCGYCDALNTKPFANGLATNVRADGSYGRPGAADNWHIATAQGLPKRYITSVQMDPSDGRTVYVTLAGYSRRWLRPGVVGGAEEGASLVGVGHVYKSTDAGETFRDISGNLPDIPADFAIVRNGQLVVATDLGVFISENTDGGAYTRLGDGLPNVPVFSLELKPKASTAEPDTLIVATQGRGVYRYVFAEDGKPALPLGDQPAPGPATQTAGTPGPNPIACAASRALTSASATGAGRALRLRFTRAVARPVTVDVFRVSEGRRVIGERRVARFTGRTRGFTWNGRGRRVGDGYYFVRFTLREPNGSADVRRIVLRRANGRWVRRPAHHGRAGCSTLRAFKLLRPVFGGPGRRALGISVTLAQPARVAVTVRRGSRVVKRFPAVQRSGTYRVSLPAQRAGDYRVTVEVVRGSERIVERLTSRALPASR